MTFDVRRSPFVVLVRTFFAQFFASENVSSEMRLRESMIFVLAFVIVPCVFLMVSIYPQYTLLMLPVSRRFAIGTIVRWGEVRHRMGADTVEWLVGVLTGYAMVAAGLVAVFVWDSLTFDRRDAMVLGPLPLRDRTVMLAKLSALALFLIGAAVGLNLLNATTFALTMSVRPVAWAGNFVSVLMVTTMAASLVLAAIVTIRGLVALVGGAGFSSAIGSVLQFLFVAALLIFLVSVIAPPQRPGLLRGAEGTLLPPIPWFVALFEVLRRSERGSWEGFIALSRYAVTVVPISVVAAIAASVAAHRRQVQIALASAPATTFWRATLSRAIARVWLPRDRVARAAADFLLITITRNPALRLPIVINAALGLGTIVVSLSRTRDDPTATLVAIPLMMAFWLSIGIRASFFVPSQLPAAWTWFVNAPDRIVSYRAAARASAIAFVAPVCVATAVILDGWRHSVVTLAFVVALASFVALSIDFIPFTQAYRPGHARLRRRWPLYLIGAFGLPYGLVSIEQRVGIDPVENAALLAVLIGLAAAFDVAGRWRSRSWRIVSPAEIADEGHATIVLGLDAAENRPMRPAAL